VYGVAGDGWGYAAETAGWNLATRDGKKLRGVPMRLKPRPGDPTVPKANNQSALSAK
jgi:hypothetical protein